MTGKVILQVLMKENMEVALYNCTNVDLNIYLTISRINIVHSLCKTVFITRYNKMNCSNHLKRLS